jgi:hypothetical protein
VSVLPRSSSNPYSVVRALKRLRREAAREIERLSAIDVVDDDPYVEIDGADTRASGNGGVHGSQIQ